MMRWCKCKKKKKKYSSRGGKLNQDPLMLARARARHFRSCPPPVASIVVGLRQSQYATVRLLLLLHWASSIKQGEWANTLKNNNHPANNQSHNGAHIMAPLYTCHEKKKLKKLKNKIKSKKHTSTHIYDRSNRKMKVLIHFCKNSRDHLKNSLHIKSKTRTVWSRWQLRRDRFDSCRNTGGIQWHSV